MGKNASWAGFAGDRARRGDGTKGGRARLTPWQHTNLLEGTTRTPLEMYRASGGNELPCSKLQGIKVK